MLKSIFNLVWYFIYRRPDKILITMLLPALIIVTLNYGENIRHYKEFMREA